MKHNKEQFQAQPFYFFMNISIEIVVFPLNFDQFLSIKFLWRREYTSDCRKYVSKEENKHHGILSAT